MRPPKFTIEDIADAYTYYVLLLGIPESIFWYADYSFVLSVVENKAAYDAWYGSAQRKQMEKQRRHNAAKARR